MASNHENTDPVYNTIDSFLNHSDFDFATATSVISSSNKQTDAELEDIANNLEEFHSIMQDEAMRKPPNKLELIIFSKKLVKGDNLHGIVKIEVEKEIQEGHIELVLESSISINRRWERKIKRFVNFVRYFKRKIHDWDLARFSRKKSKINLNQSSKILKKIKKKEKEDKNEELVLGDIKRVLYDKTSQAAKTVKRDIKKSLRRLGTSITNEIKATKKKKILLKKKSTMSTFYKPFMYYQKKKNRSQANSPNNISQNASMISNKSVKSYDIHKDKGSSSGGKTPQNKSEIRSNKSKNSRNSKNSSKRSRKKKRRTSRSEVNLDRDSTRKKIVGDQPQKSKTMKPHALNNLEKEVESNLDLNSRMRSRFEEENEFYENSNNFLDFENFMLSKDRRILFRLDQRIDQKTVLILPFKLTFPKNISASHNHTLHTDDKISFRKLLSKRSEMLNLDPKIGSIGTFKNSMLNVENGRFKSNAEEEKRKIAGKDFRNRIKDDRNIRSLISQKLSDQKLEGVKIEHKLSAYFIPKKSVKNIFFFQLFSIFT